MEKDRTRPCLCSFVSLSVEVILLCGGYSKGGVSILVILGLWCFGQCWHIAGGEMFIENINGVWIFPFWEMGLRILHISGVFTAKAFD